jgi:hypothetical protein
MHISHESGRYDHLHGDEEYRDHLGAEAIDYIDVLRAIEAETGTHDGMHYYHWCQRIAESDEMTTIIKHIVKNRHKPEFAEIMNEIELAIEGWLP